VLFLIIIFLCKKFKDTTSSSTTVTTSSTTATGLMIASDLFNSNSSGGQLNNVLQTYTGDMSSCLANCSNQGICTLNSAQKYVCQCNQYRTGSSCQIDSRPCSSNPCLNNGTCVNTNNETSFECICLNNVYYGIYCENKIDLCKNSTICFNNQGNCIMNETEIMCKCKKDYSGINCEIMSTALVVRNTIINVASLIAIIFIACLILLVLFFDYTKYFVMSKQVNKNESINQVEMKTFYYHP